MIVQTKGNNLKSISILIMMSPKKLALDLDRVHKALDQALTPPEHPEPVKKLSIEETSIVENTDKLEVEKTSLTSANDEFLNTVVNDYKSDLLELERSISEYREYLKKLTNKEKGTE